MKNALSILMLLAFIHCIKCKSIYYDGDIKPYKFEFKIQQYQHRLEEKDDRGIVHGEYGFLTADGVYHVTAYMTDENGNYRLVGTRSVEFQTFLENLTPEQREKLFRKPKALDRPPATTRSPATSKSLSFQPVQPSLLSGLQNTNTPQNFHSTGILNSNSQHLGLAGAHLARGNAAEHSSGDVESNVDADFGKRIGGGSLGLANGNGATAGLGNRVGSISNVGNELNGDVGVDLGGGVTILKPGSGTSQGNVLGNLGSDAGAGLGGSSQNSRLNVGTNLGNGVGNLGLNAGAGLGRSSINSGLNAGTNLGNGVGNLGSNAGAGLGRSSINSGLNAGTNLGNGVGNLGLNAGSALGSGIGNLGSNNNAGLVGPSAKPGLHAGSNLGNAVGNLGSNSAAGLEGTSVNAGLNAGVDLDDGLTILKPGNGADKGNGLGNLGSNINTGLGNTSARSGLNAGSNIGRGLGNLESNVGASLGSELGGLGPNVNSKSGTIGVNTGEDIEIIVPNLEDLTNKKSNVAGNAGINRGNGRPSISSLSPSLNLKVVGVSDPSGGIGVNVNSGLKKEDIQGVVKTIMSHMEKYILENVFGIPQNSPINNNQNINLNKTPVNIQFTGYPQSKGNTFATVGTMEYKATNGLLYRFSYTVTFHSHEESGDRAGNKQGSYSFVDRSGIRHTVTYTADENGFHPIVKSEKVAADEVPHEETEKELTVLKKFEFKWFNEQR